METSGLCPEDRLASLVEQVGADEHRGLDKVEGVLRDFPGDPRLHFLHGSLLAAGGDYADARTAMRRAVDLAPDYAIARFQLGFLLLTSGEPHAAQEAWGPLHALPSTNPLRCFVEGLCHMIRDEFGPAIGRLEEGIALNRENPPLNRDMQLVITELRDRVAAAARDGEPSSASELLLQQSALRATKH